MAFFHVAYVGVTRNSCFVLFREGTDFPAGALLWNETEPATDPAELVLRSMWVSLSTKALEQQWGYDVSTDEFGNVTGIDVVDEVNGAKISVPRDDAQRAELVSELQRRQTRALA